MKALENTYGPSVANRPTDHTPRVASGAYFQWEDLGRVEPRDGQPRCSKDCREEEHEENRGATHAGGVCASGFGIDRSASETTRAEHTDTLAD